MIIAAAQSSPIQGALHDNLEEHFELIKLAAKHNVELITFPEMSITGYVREQGQKLSLTIYDACINILRDLAAEYQMTIIAGAPVQVKTEPHIGSFIITQDGGVDIYTKQYLHDGEELFYSTSFENNPQIKLNGEKASLAICADIETEQHIIEASQKEASLYLPSIFYTPQSIGAAHDKLATYARKYKLNILMSNFCGECYGSIAGGKSAFWNSKGECIASLNKAQSGLLILRKENGNWLGNEVYK